MKCEIKEYEGLYYPLIDGDVLKSLVFRTPVRASFKTFDECLDFLTTRAKARKGQTLEDAKVVYSIDL